MTIVVISIQLYDPHLNPFEQFLPDEDGIVIHKGEVHVEGKWKTSSDHNFSS